MQLEAAGVPTVVVATSKFRRLTEQVAAGLDAPDIRILEVPHPLGGTDEATIEGWADAAVDPTLALLGVVPPASETSSSDANAAGGVDAAVAEVRQLIAADGGDIELVEHEGSMIRLRLILETAECRECVMPAEFLQQVALDMMQPHVAGLTQVVIEDPRNAK